LRFGDVVRGFQIAGADESGQHRGWKWFRTGKIENLVVLPTHFTGPRTGCELTVERLERPYCHLQDMPLPRGPIRPLPPDCVVDC
jgi:hypothetical protein